MRYEIIFAPEAVRDLAQFTAYQCAIIRDELEKHLRHAPTQISKSRIKRLQGLARPQFRLRIGEIRVYYDATETTVEVLAVLSKPDAAAWLKQEGKPI